MNTVVELAAEDGHKLSAYCARPDSVEPRAALVIIQELFGVNSHIRAVCDRFAADGYLALAPALYDRVERGLELSYAPEGVAKGRQVRTIVNNEIAMRDVGAAVDFTVAKLAGRAKIGVVGYCWGGSLAWLAAARLDPISAAVGYYGSGIAGYLDEKPKVPVLLHFGRKDAQIPVADVEKIVAAFPELPVHLYDAGHGFNCDDRISYEPGSAKLALQRTSEFFRKHLG